MFKNKNKPCALCSYDITIKAVLCNDCKKIKEWVRLHGLKQILDFINNNNSPAVVVRGQPVPSAPIMY